jgi:hypothetical protein
MPDLANSDFLAAINNTSVAACFNSSGTLPSTVTPVQIISCLLDAYKMAQNQANEINTGTEFINTIISVQNEPVLFDSDKNPYMDTVTTVRVKKVLTSSVVQPYIGELQLL